MKHLELTVAGVLLAVLLIFGWAFTCNWEASCMMDLTSQALELKEQLEDD